VEEGGSIGWDGLVLLSNNNAKAEVSGKCLEVTIAVE
jgi:hypothetical protein